MLRISLPLKLMLLPIKHQHLLKSNKNNIYSKQAELLSKAAYNAYIAAKEVEHAESKIDINYYHKSIRTKKNSVNNNSNYKNLAWKLKKLNKPRTQPTTNIRKPYTY